MTTWSNFNFPDGNSPIMEQLLIFHNHTMFIVIMIMSFICYFMINMAYNSFKCSMIHEGQMIEITWTMAPMILLLFIAGPSLRLLYLMEENFNPEITIKVLGHQWYWSYELPNFNINFDSFLLPESSLIKQNFRLLEVDNRLITPYNTMIRVLITSSDVIHAWTIPSSGVKMDAIPGRLNQVNMINKRSGLFFGQCSEICGANHSFMPILMESTCLKLFFNWIKKN